MLFELHAHSWYSKDKFGDEGYASPVELVRVAKERGLNGIAITDHNCFKSWDSVKNLRLDDFLIIPGEEVSTRQGHMIALGINEFVRPGRHFLETIDEIHGKGGIVIAPHPFDLHGKGLEERSQHCDAIEAFNAMSLDRFSNIRAKKFCALHEKAAVAGSDAHTSSMLGRGVTQINSELYIDSVLDSVRAGRTKITGNYHPVREMTSWYVDRLNSNPNLAQEHIEKNHHPLKQTALKLLIEHQKKDGLASRGIVTLLPYLTTAGSSAKSAAANGLGCLI
ncbi:MAG: CehA/McbA family metallohydrolase [Candidatus Aenigmatarchaeota archaeon]